MSQTEKAAYYQALKDAGVEATKHYRDYSTEELKEAHAHLTASFLAAGEILPPVVIPEPKAKATATPPRTDPELPFTVEGGYDPLPPQGDATVGYSPPRAAQADPNEMPGQRLNTTEADEVIRVDDEGRHWLQEEVLKPAVPRPRGRRVLMYQNTGIEKKTIVSGDYSESFEVAGQGQGTSEQIKITLPSYQVGIYRDRRFPFKVITYAGQQGFELFEVRDYYGGAELVPSDVKLMYVSNTLCYDIRTTIRAIEAEYRRLQLSGRVD